MHFRTRDDGVEVSSITFLHLYAGKDRRGPGRNKRVCIHNYLIMKQNTSRKAGVLFWQKWGRLQAGAPNDRRQDKRTELFSVGGKRRAELSQLEHPLEAESSTIFACFAALKCLRRLVGGHKNPPRRCAVFLVVRPASSFCHYSPPWVWRCCWLGE